MSAFWLKKCLPGSVDRSRGIGRIVAYLEELPEEKAWHVSVEEAKSERSLQQNRYLFGVAYKLLSEATGYEKDDIHTYLLGKHFGTKLKRVPKSVYNPRGLIEIPVRTTTMDEHGHRSVLGKMAFAEYVEFVKRFGAEAGVVIPDPDQDQIDEHVRAA
jgi:hypothetical protein